MNDKDQTKVMKLSRVNAKRDKAATEAIELTKRQAIWQKLEEIQQALRSDDGASLRESVSELARMMELPEGQFDE